MEQSTTLSANESGRLWGEDRDEWHLLSAREGCRVCNRDPGGRGALLETARCWINVWPEAPLPGYVCVFSKSHVVEPYELDEADQVQFWLDCMAVARGLTALLNPAKMQLRDPWQHGPAPAHASLPTQSNDVYVGYPNHCRAVFERSPEDVERLASAIRRSLGSRAL